MASVGKASVSNTMTVFLVNTDLAVTEKTTVSVVQVQHGHLYTLLKGIFLDLACDSGGGGGGVWGGGLARQVYPAIPLRILESAVQGPSTTK